MNTNPADEIKCPFLAMAMPPSDFQGFVRACQNYGMSYPMALLVTCQVTTRQKGFLALLKGETPDLHRLDEVEGISHTDLYSAYLSEARTMANEIAVDGQITLQDLVTIKEWIASQENVSIIDSSKIETALIFLGAGGDLETSLVSVDDVFTLLQGIQPSSYGEVTPAKLAQARKMARWQI
ncbi:MAG: hypothetical protein AAF490_29225 [Chloroflexota bacterium]